LCSFAGVWVFCVEFIVFFVDTWYGCGIHQCPL
jgi:hypothetical protein